MTEIRLSHVSHLQIAALPMLTLKACALILSALAGPTLPLSSLEHEKIAPFRHGWKSTERM